MGDFLTGKPSRYVTSRPGRVSVSAFDLSSNKMAMTDVNTAYWYVYPVYEFHNNSDEL